MNVIRFHAQNATESCLSFLTQIIGAQLSGPLFSDHLGMRKLQAFTGSCNALYLGM